MFIFDYPIRKIIDQSSLSQSCYLIDTHTWAVNNLVVCVLDRGDYATFGYRGYHSPLWGSPLNTQYNWMGFVFFPSHIFQRRDSVSQVTFKYPIAQWGVELSRLMNRIQEEVVLKGIEDNRQPTQKRLLLLFWGAPRKFSNDLFEGFLKVSSLQVSFDLGFVRKSMDSSSWSYLFERWGSLRDQFLPRKLVQRFYA